MGMKKNINIQAGIRVALFSILIILGAQPVAYTNPEDGEVVEGEVQIVQESPSRLNIVQSTDKAIINWQGFSIGQGEHTDFQQPSSDAITLNRVLGNNPSEILGSLTANGRVVLVNPNGIFFEKGSTVDVSAFIASTQDISNPDFMAGKLNFSSPINSASQIINRGTINIKDSGLAALVAPSIQNSGAIIARLGKVALASGDSVTIDLYGDDLILFDLGNETGIASGASSTMSSLIENSGRIQADGGWVLLAVNEAKDIVDQSINMSGVIQTRTVDIQDGQIILKAGDEGLLTVSGTLDASAPYGGNGGFIETSAGYVNINPGAAISTSAVYGNTGEWLLDPVDYTVATGGDITGAALGSYLNQNNVEIRTSATGLGNGDIYVNSPVSWSSSNTLTLSAHRNINIYGAITNNNGGSLSLRSDYDADGTGTVSFGMGGAVTMSGEGIASIFYNPSLGYASPTDYSSYFTGTEPTAYMLVHSLEDLQAISENLAGSYALSKNIDAAATSTWNSGAGFVPIGHSDDPFTGNFNGNGYTISDLTINRLPTWEIGLFGYLDHPAVVSNLGLIRPIISGNRTVGGLAGYNGGIISNVSITDGHISGINGWIGGLVGITWAGEIYDSYSNAEVSSTVYGDEIGGLAGSNSDSIIERSYSAGSVSGGNHIGGLVGHNSGDITDSYSTSSVSGYENVGGLIGEFHGGTLYRSYSAGAVSGTSEVGGLIGFIEDGLDDDIIVNSYWDTLTSGQSTSAGGTGLTTTQMKSQASFSGWNFTDVWSISANQYPLLRTSGHQVIVNPDDLVLPDDDPNDPNDPNNPPPYPPPYPPPSLASIPVSWFQGAVHYDSWDDYLNNNPWFITGLSWSESAPHYSSWEEYLKTGPFVTTVSMNKSIQLDSQGRFKDGMLNPLGYLTTIGSDGLGFASLKDGGAYKGYSESGSSYETRLAWAEAALKMAEEARKQRSTYDPAIAKMWEDAAMARLRLQSRKNAGDAGPDRLGNQSGQGGSEITSQGVIDGASSDEQSQDIQKLTDTRLLNPDFVRRGSKGTMGIMDETSTEIQRLLEKGVINPDALIRDSEGNWVPKGDGSDWFLLGSTFDEKDKAVQWLMNNNILNAESITLKDGRWFVNTVDTDTPKWEEKTYSSYELHDSDLIDALRSVRIQEAIDKGTLNPAFVAKDLKGVLSIMNDESTEIQRGILNGTLDPRFYTAGLDGNWQPQTQEQKNAQSKWDQSQSIQKQLNEGTLNPDYVVKDYLGNLSMLNAESIAIKEGIKNGTINPDYVIKRFDGNLEVGGLSKELQNLDEGETAEKLISLSNKGWQGIDYKDNLAVIRNLSTDQIKEIITDKNLSKDGFETFTPYLVRTADPSKLAGIILDLPEGKRNQLMQVLQTTDTMNLSVADVLQKMPASELEDIAPQITISQLHYIEKFDPDLITALEPGLPPGWQAATKGYENTVFDISNLGKGIPYSFPNDMPIGQWLNTHVEQGHDLQQTQQEE